MSNYPLNESFGLLQIHIQDFASALLENFNCIVGVITSLQLYRRLSIITSISVKDILQKVQRTLKITIKMASGVLRTSDILCLY